MYAQLCKRLSEEAPNLEPEGQPCTFRLLLLNKCRAEFENRALTFAAFDEKETLTAEEEEKRHLAKCKMLGNIKFIGELGKLEILAESILHRCIQKLLARRGGGENVDDLECLAQLVRTCGRVLDSARGRRLVDQYFARMAALAGAPGLPPRIRFMLRDVVELRRGGWVPRAAAASDPPVPITQLGGEEPPRRDPLFRRDQRPAMDHVLAGLPSPASHPIDKLFSNGFPSAPFRHRSAPNYFPPKTPNKHQSSQNNHSKENNSSGSVGSGGRRGGGRVGVTPPAEVQMRPAANSLLYSAKGLTRAAPPTPAPAHPALPLPPTPAGAAFGGAGLAKEPAITIKPAPDKANKPKKDKGVNKEEACRAAIDAARALSERGAEADGSAELAALQALQLPDKLARRAAAALLEWAGEQPGAAAAACSLVRHLRRAAAADPLRALAARRPPPPHAAALLAHAVNHKLVSLSEIGGWLEGGQQYPLLLDILQALSGVVGVESLRQLYVEAKLSALQYVREAAAATTDDAALAALESRGLGALEPSLRVGAALARALAADPAPAALYRWIKSHVEPDTRAHAAFVHALVAALANHIHQTTGSSADKASVERERTLVAGYVPLLRALLQNQPELQLAAIYAVQVQAQLGAWPRGLLLRWFMYLYNLEVCEEEAFLRWREDHADTRPGKGDALFQVNTWLTWLQQQESEDEEAED